MENVKQVFGDRIQFANEQYETLIGADSLAVITEWPVFRVPSYKVLRELLSEPVVFDGRNIYDPKVMEAEGFYYDSIGRNKVVQKAEA